MILHAYKVLDKSGNGDDAGVIDAIDHLAGRIDGGLVSAPVVANMSFTTSGQTKSGVCTAAGYAPGAPGTYDSYHRAVCEAAHWGIIVVTAAGNGGADAVNYVPAAQDESAITVSATHEGDGWTYLSNYGTGSASWTVSGKNSAPVAIAAPGDGILTTTNNGGYVENSGTSFAAPHVAGAVALWLESLGAVGCAGYACYMGARDAILGTAEDLPTYVSDALLGATNPHNEDLLDVR